MCFYSKECVMKKPDFYRFCHGCHHRFAQRLCNNQQLGTGVGAVAGGVVGDAVIGGTLGTWGAVPVPSSATRLAKPRQKITALAWAA